jgi:integrase
MRPDELERRLGERLDDAYATALLTAGVHPTVASGALGHSSVAFTTDTYQYLMPTMQEQADRAIEEAIWRHGGGRTRRWPTVET